MMMDGCAGGMILWPLLFIALVLGGVWLIGKAVRGRPTTAGSDPAPSPGAMRILEERFARGEISPEEFEERRQALEGR